MLKRQKMNKRKFNQKGQIYKGTEWHLTILCITNICVLLQRKCLYVFWVHHIICYEQNFWPILVCWKQFTHRVKVVKLANFFHFTFSHFSEKFYHTLVCNTWTSRSIYVQNHISLVNKNKNTLISKLNSFFSIYHIKVIKVWLDYILKYMNRILTSYLRN